MEDRSSSHPLTPFRCMNTFKCMDLNIRPIENELKVIN